MRNADVSNVEALRNYFLGKDPQLKETLADNSLRLIGIPGRNFVLRTELMKAVDKLTKDIELESTTREGEDTRIRQDISAIERVMLTQDEAEALLLNYYTKAQVDDIISHIQTLKLEVVQELPVTGRTDTIYLVPNSGSSGNIYDEYIYINSNWELIGSTEVDLSNYYTKSEVDALIAQAETGSAQEINPLLITDNTVQLNDLDPGLYIVPEGLKIHFGRLSNENWIYTAKTDTTITIFETVFNGNTYTHGMLIDGYTIEPTLVAGRRRKSGAQSMIGNYIATDLTDAIETISVNGVGQTITNHNVDITVPTDTSDLTNNAGFINQTTADGRYVEVTGDTMTGELTNTSAITVGSREPGRTVGGSSLTVGYQCVAGDSAFAQGGGSEATGNYAVALNSGTEATANFSFAHGQDSVASGVASHAEGGFGTVASFYGESTLPPTTASGRNSHAEGGSTLASGKDAHAEGEQCHATHDYTHVEGYGTKSTTSMQHVEGKFNKLTDLYTDYQHVVGGGLTDSSRANNYSLDFQGNGWFRGNVYVNNGVGDDRGYNHGLNAKKLATEDYVEIRSISVNNTTLFPDASKNVEISVPVYTAGANISIDANNEISVTGIVSTGGGGTSLTLVEGQYYEAEYVGWEPQLITEANSGYYMVENTTNANEKVAIQFSSAINDDLYVAFVMNTRGEVKDTPDLWTYQNDTGSIHYFEDRAIGANLEPGEKLIVSCQSTNTYPPSAILCNPTNEQTIQYVDGYYADGIVGHTIQISASEDWRYYVYENTGNAGTFGLEITGDSSDSSLYVVTDSNDEVLLNANHDSVSDAYFGIYLNQGDKLYVNMYMPNYTPVVKVYAGDPPAVLDNYALKTEVPTDTSDLTNGAGFQTASDINSKFTYGTSDLTPGTSPLAEGNFYFVYE